MNKKVLLTGALAALILAAAGIFYKGGPQPGPAEPSAQAQQGVELPPPPPADGAAEPPPPPPASSAYSLLDMDGAAAACENGSVADIAAAEGRTWGRKADAAVFHVLSRKDSESALSLFNKYVTCAAFKRGDTAVCGFGADFGGGEGPSFRYDCESAMKELSAMAYMAGRTRSSAACAWFLSESAADYPRSGLDKLSAGDFCAAAAGGMEGLCAAFPSIEPAACRKAFPAAAGDCAGDRDCLETLALYQAVRNSDYTRCPAESRDECRLFLNREGLSCAAPAAAASKAYCEGLARAKENSFITLRSRHEAAKKAREEAEARESQIREINERIRASKGKN